ncbi:class I SAM-dependent methyltransferase [Nocardia iowensis]|uniref:Class I SAM-dependent methyltransferase n=1 Tax=Nocardia iowensis TaxID=204891 RepID=A0ABX8RVM6_NOCIO|nr:class I SAM-dependent methyltransferase [Nocardia iowensis]QXN92927.1 class I SAM-dependent methyltransferase [Nocardia iowensis]
MDWVQRFFDTAPQWWGPQAVRESDRRRAESIARLAGTGVERVLELGAGSGTTAVVTADLGYSVVAVELSSVRARQASERAGEVAGRDLRIVEGDFYAVELGEQFDCVVYWNGFGVGTDAEQRALLRRVSAEWLRPGGAMIVDVFSPWKWARVAGELDHEKYVVELANSNDYDPVTSRFNDRWWPVGKESEALDQFGRCYTPADLLLLVEGTGLAVERMELDGTELRPDQRYSATHPLWDAWEYQAVLRRTA